MSGEITQLLKQWGEGDVAALDRLVPLVYDDLRRLARHHLQQQGANRTLQPTAVVNEAYLRLARQSHIEFENRSQFFGLAAKLIRDLLVDDTRRRLAEKRGGDGLRVSMADAEAAAAPAEFDLLALDEALTRLSQNKPQHGRIVELRFFGGLTIAETAALLGVSHATVERDWNFARAWLYGELAG